MQKWSWQRCNGRCFGKLHCSNVEYCLLRTLSYLHFQRGFTSSKLPFARIRRELLRRFLRIHLWQESLFYTIVRLMSSTLLKNECFRKSFILILRKFYRNHFSECLWLPSFGPVRGDKDAKSQLRQNFKTNDNIIL